jgi:hypothetical protein
VGRRVRLRALDALFAVVQSGSMKAAERRCSSFHIWRFPENQDHIQFIGLKNFPDRVLIGAFARR